MDKEEEEEEEEEEEGEPVNVFLSILTSFTLFWMSKCVQTASPKG